MTRLSVDSVNYNVLTWGHGVPVVLLHGFMGSALSWGTIAEQLAQHHKVIAIDILGHGDSDKPIDYQRYQMACVAEDLAKLIKALTAAPPYLLGYSMGGRLALYFAVQYPQLVRSLILESASPGLQDDEARWERLHKDKHLAGRIEGEGVKAFVDFWEYLPLWHTQCGLDQDVLKAQRQQRLMNNPQGIANSLRGMGTGMQPVLWERLDELDMPVHLIVGGKDDKFLAINQAMQRRLSNSKLSILNEAGHNTHLEQPETFAQVVLASTIQ